VRVIFLRCVVPTLLCLRLPFCMYSLSLSLTDCFDTFVRVDMLRLMQYSCLRAVNVCWMAARFETKLKLPWIKLRLLKAMFLVMLFMHWNCEGFSCRMSPFSTVRRLDCGFRDFVAGCLHFLTASLNDFHEKTWVARNGLVYASDFTQYTFSLMAVVSMMVGCGWGTYPSGGPMVCPLILKLFPTKFCRVRRGVLLFSAAVGTVGHVLHHVLWSKCVGG
jgi:hypothetical protein